MMGSGYVIDHCIAAINQEAKERAYQEYIADCSRFISHSTAVIASVLSEGKEDVSYMGKPFREILTASQEPEDTRTSDEIINSFLDYFGKKEVETE